MDIDRLTDPGEHFPYKLGDALAALESSPAPGTRNHPESWYTSRRIIHASDAYVSAQERLLLNPGDPAVLQAYRDAKAELLAARAEHRADRTTPTIGADLAGV